MNEQLGQDIERTVRVLPILAEGSYVQEGNRHVSMSEKYDLVTDITILDQKTGERKTKYLRYLGVDMQSVINFCCRIPKQEIDDACERRVS